MSPFTLNHFTSRRIWKTILVVAVLSCVLPYAIYSAIYVTFMYDDVYQLKYNQEKDHGWKTKTFAAIENVFQTSMTYFDFRGDDCRGCLIKDYKIMVHPRNICNEVSNSVKAPQLLLLIFSTFGERAARDAVRNTWLAAYLNHTGEVRYVFMIGKGMDSRQQMDLDSENQQYSDILQHDYLESVRNMTLKTISGFRWATKHCAKVPHIMKVDTDIWLNIPKWIDFIFQSKGQTFLETSMIGHCRSSPAVIRFPLHRYSVSVEAFPDKRYPPYCRGPSYYLSGKLVREVANISYSQPFIAVEDAYVGWCLKKLGYGVYNPLGLTLLDLSRLRKQAENDPCSLRRDVYTIHDVSPGELAALWKKTSKCIL